MLCPEGDWVTNLATGTTHFLIGSCFGLHPFPTTVRDYEISSEPEMVAMRSDLSTISCQTRAVGVEAGGDGQSGMPTLMCLVSQPGPDGDRHSATLAGTTRPPGRYCLATSDGKFHRPDEKRLALHDLHVE